MQNDLHILTERLTRITESLNKKYATRTEFDRTIADTEGAYMKVRVQSWLDIRSDLLALSIDPGKLAKLTAGA